MSVLTTAQRSDLPDSAFALPGRRYPIFDKHHAQNAKARAQQMKEMGRLSHEEYETVVKKADAVLSGD